MDARQLLSMIFFPWHARGAGFFADPSPTRKEMALPVAMIAIESWILAITIEYWWFGQIFIKSTMLVIGFFVLLVIVIPAVISRRFTTMVTWDAWILVLPTIASIIAMIMLRGGLMPVNPGPSIVQIPGLMILECGAIAWILLWKFAGYAVQFKVLKLSIPPALRIMDIIGIVAWGALVIFIKYVMRVFLLF